MGKVVILHGLGQTIEDWDSVAENLDNQSIRLNLFEDILSDSVLTIEALYSNVSKQLDEIREPFYLCGLSLGGLLALMYVTKKSNNNIQGIIVSGAIYKPIPRWINYIQNILFYIMPKSTFKKMGLERSQAITLTKSINVDLTKELTKLALPSLIICGEKDNTNMKESTKLNSLIKESTFHVLPNGGHELNKDSPVEFSGLINNFIKSQNTHKI